MGRPRLTTWLITGSISVAAIGGGWAVGSVNPDPTDPRPAIVADIPSSAPSAASSTTPASPSAKPRPTRPVPTAQPASAPSAQSSQLDSSDMTFDQPRTQNRSQPRTHADSRPRPVNPGAPVPAGSIDSPVSPASAPSVDS